MTKFPPYKAHFAADLIAWPVTFAACFSLSRFKFRDELGISRKGAGRFAPFLVCFRRPRIATAFSVTGKLLLSPSRILPSFFHSLRLALSLNWGDFVGISSSVAILMAIGAKINCAVFHSTTFAPWLQMVSVEMLAEHFTISAMATHDGNYIFNEDYLWLFE